MNDIVKINEDKKLKLRPEYLNEFIGQDEIKEMLNIYIKAAKKRNESLDHVLFYGPAGLGKTTLAQIIANELDVDIKITSGPSIITKGDLIALLASLEPGDILFIDEVHRLPVFIEEVLYSVMEDYFLDLIIGEGEEKRNIRLDLPPFTLVAATTRFGDLQSPLRDRFGVVFRLNYYNIKDLEDIILRTSKVYKTKIDNDALTEIAKRSRKTPRIANMLFRRVRDFADIKTKGIINKNITKQALSKLKITNSGLNENDIIYLDCLINKFKGGPVGLETISKTIGEEIMTVLDVYEPYLILEGYINRTSRGRVATKKAYKEIEYYKSHNFNKKYK